MVTGKDLHWTAVPDSSGYHVAVHEHRTWFSLDGGMSWEFSIGLEGLTYDQCAEVIRFREVQYLEGFRAGEAAKAAEIRLALEIRSAVGVPRR